MKLQLLIILVLLSPFVFGESPPSQKMVGKICTKVFHPKAIKPNICRDEPWECRQLCVSSQVKLAKNEYDCAPFAGHDESECLYTLAIQKKDSQFCHFMLSESQKIRCFDFFKDCKNIDDLNAMQSCQKDLEKEAIERIKAGNTPDCSKEKNFEVIRECERHTRELEMLRFAAERGIKYCEEVEARYQVHNFYYQNRGLVPANSPGTPEKKKWDASVPFEKCIDSANVNSKTCDQIDKLTSFYTYDLCQKKVKSCDKIVLPDLARECYQDNLAVFAKKWGAEKTLSACEGPKAIENIKSDGMGLFGNRRVCIEKVFLSLLKEKEKDRTLLKKICDGIKTLRRQILDDKVDNFSGVFDGDCEEML